MLTLLCCCCGGGGRCSGEGASGALARGEEEVASSGSALGYLLPPLPCVAEHKAVSRWRLQSMHPPSPPLGGWLVCPGGGGSHVLCASIAKGVKGAEEYRAALGCCWY